MGVECWFVIDGEQRRKGHRLRRRECEAVQEVTIVYCLQMLGFGRNKTRTQTVRVHPQSIRVQATAQTGGEQGRELSLHSSRARIFHGLGLVLSPPFLRTAVIPKAYAWQSGRVRIVSNQISRRTPKSFLLMSAFDSHRVRQVAAEFAEPVDHRPEFRLTDRCRMTRPAAGANYHVDFMVRLRLSS